MKIKRFVAADIRQALRQVRETLGADAVILSNKSVDGGVELVAALDYDEEAFLAETESRGSDGMPGEGYPYDIEAAGAAKDEAPISGNRSTPAEQGEQHDLAHMYQEMKALRQMMENQLSEITWREMGSRRPQSQELLRRLMGLQICPDICRQLVDRVADVEGLDSAWRKALYSLAGELPVVDDDLLDEGGVVALVGPTGVGKTTTIAKLAARFVLRHGHRKLALVSTDGYRIGAQEQLNSYARILDVAVRTATTSDELDLALNSLADKQLVLVDTAGMSQRDVRLSEQLSLLSSGNRPVKSFLTLAATTQQSALEQSIRAFGGADLAGCILTKVDESASLGGALSAIIHGGLPLTFYTDGQKVPEDVHLARANTLVSRAVTLGQESGAEYNEEYLALALGGARVDAHG